jgi:L,D-transpeptidase YcbB
MTTGFRVLLIIICFPLLSFSGELISDGIKVRVEQLEVDKNTRIAGQQIHSIEYISNLYKKNNFNPFWTKTEYVIDAILGLKGAYEDGLLASDYHLEAIIELEKEVEALRGETDIKVSKTADLDLLITDGVIFYANHLLYGKVDPVALVPTWNYGFSPIPDLNPVTLNQYIEKGEIASRLKELRPDNFLYDSLLSTLSKYRDFDEKGGWESILAGGKIEPGSSDARIPAIRKRLQITGELSSSDSISSSVYDKILEKDIRVFQSSHGLDTDGIIGAGTFRELNVPVEDRVASIRINLERVRWVAGNMPSRYIIVNIAAFWLYVVDSGKIVHYTPVVVGKPLNKTPLFRDKMRYIEFNPTWTQPISIVKNETIPKLKKDSAYLEKNHYILLDSKGNLVPDSTIDFKNLSASKFPYMVRQEPGPWNALGEMKFMFPNKYDIYLHDTPSKSLFSKASRAYSHPGEKSHRPGGETA